MTKYKRGKAQTPNRVSEVVILGNLTLTVALTRADYRAE